MWALIALILIPSTGEHKTYTTFYQYHGSCMADIIEARNQGHKYTMICVKVRK